MSKQDAKTQLAVSQSMIHRDWLRLNKYLIDNTDEDPVIREMCKNLSAGFRSCAAQDFKLNPSAVRLPMTPEIEALEAELTAKGWK